jgi:PAS domain S-box-containing protein
MNVESKPTPIDQRLFLIFIVTFATMTVFEFVGQFIYPYPPDWRSNLVTSLFASGLAVIIAYIPLNAYYSESARVLSEMEKRRLVETELRESESRLSSIIRVAPVGIGVEFDRIIRTVNDQLCHITGYTAEDLTGISSRRLYLTDEDFTSVGREIHAQIAQNGSAEVETRWQRKDGTIIDVIISSTPVDPSNISLGVTFTALDITEKKRAETALRESENKFATIFRSSPVALSLVSVADETFVDVNHAFVRNTWYSRDEVVGRTAESLGLVADKNDLEKMASLLRDQQRIYNLEVKFRIKTGEIRTCLFSSSIIPMGGKPYVLSSVEDITERKKVEEALRESEEKFRMVVENTLDGILIVALTGEILFGNRALANIFDAGGESHRSGMTNVMEYIAPESRSQVLHDFSQVAQGIDSYPMNYRAITATGRRIWVESIGKRIQFQNSPAILISMKDITDRKRMEDAILRANKQLNLLSSITRHDINNQLQVLNGFAELLRIKMPDPSVENYFSRLMEASSQITAMIRFTKEYEKIGVHAAVWQDLQALVNSVGKNATLGQVTLKNDLPANLEVFADPLIAKVFFNLIDNALRHGGRITTIRFSFEARNEVGLIVCEDDGNGVVTEEKERIFDRGFGKNTGLGLALAREILDITGITIKETGEPGRGARFEVVVPKEACRFAKPMKE